MSYYELLLPNDVRVDLSEISPRTLRSVGSSRRASEPVSNPGGLQKDAVAAGERFALSLLATGREGDVAVVRVTAGGRDRAVVARASAVYDSKPGYAIVESRERGARRVEIPSIVEDAGRREYADPVEVARRLAVLVATEGVDETVALETLGAESNRSALAVSRLATHGVAIAKRDGLRVRKGGEPVVSILPSPARVAS